MEDNSKATYRPRRLRLKLGDTSGYVAAPRPGQLSHALHSAPTIPSVAATTRGQKQWDDVSVWSSVTRLGTPRMAEGCFQKAPGQDLAQTGRVPMVTEGDLNCRPKGPQTAEICFQKAPGQDLAQKEPFPSGPRRQFNCRPKGPQIAEKCFQKAPGQDLAQNGRFPMVPEGNFNCRPKGPQIAEICFQKAPGQDLAQNGRFPMVPEGDFNCRPKALKLQKFASKRPLARIWPFWAPPGGGRKHEQMFLGLGFFPLLGTLAYALQQPLYN